MITSTHVTLFNRLKSNIVLFLAYTRVLFPENLLGFPVHVKLSYRIVSYRIQISEILWNSERIRSYSRSRSSKAIDLDDNRKRICDFL